MNQLSSLHQALLIVVTELRALIGRHAKDVGEKWKIWDERDKILRKARRQITEVGHGNCPDMCPEKERYQREVRNQVSPYEGHKESQKVMDPVRAVKDYSRSAADQEEPLPHDMRPSSVLRYTMDYLLANIIRNEPPCDTLNCSIGSIFYGHGREPSERI